MLTGIPEIFFDLTRRNERDILAPFMKYFKHRLVALRDRDGNTLLHVAVQSHGLMQNMVELLLQCGLSAHDENNKGVTPAQLAVKGRKEKLMKMLGAPM